MLDEVQSHRLEIYARLRAPADSHRPQHAEDGSDHEHRELPAAPAEPKMVPSELRYAFTGGSVLRQEQGGRAEAQQFMLAQDWLRPLNRHYLAITDAGGAEHRRRDRRSPGIPR